MTILSFDPDPSSPQIQIELSGILVDGRLVLAPGGTVEAETSKVNTPEVETLYWVTAFPLKEKENGMDCTLVHTGVVAEPAWMEVHDPSKLSIVVSSPVFKPPGFPGKSK